jgi:hypothetical protein
MRGSSVIERERNAAPVLAAGYPARWTANMTLRCLLAFSLLLSVSTPSHAEQITQREYSTAPLGQPLFDEAQITIETMAINNWLNSNLQKLSHEQMKGPREHLYYLIDSRVKQIYAAEQQILPTKHDLILGTLFSWAEPLGVFGGALAFNAIKAPTSSARTPGMKMPDGISMELIKDLFTVKSTTGWSISFPYYFMVWNIGDFVAKGGPRTQLVALSTGAAKDKSQAGRSQATLVFLYSPEEYETFDKYWREQMGVDANVESKPLGVKGLASRHVIEASSKLHKEFTSWSAPEGSFAVAYLGIEGTYEWNRPHFVDFLRSVSAQSRSNK